MPRNIDPTMLAALGDANIRPAFFASITFASKTEYIWTGAGDYLWNSQTWKGIGDAASIGTYAEGTDVTANGITVTLSGINNDLLGESLTDIQLGAPATIYFALLDDNMNIIGTPTVFFGGIVDKPAIHIGTDTSTIALSLETNFIRLQQGQRLRYTSADQRRLVPGDSGFDFVEKMNDIAIIWQPS